MGILQLSSRVYWIGLQNYLYNILSKSHCYSPPYPNNNNNTRRYWFKNRQINSKKWFPLVYVLALKLFLNTTLINKLLLCLFLESTATKLTFHTEPYSRKNINIKLRDNTKRDLIYNSVTLLIYVYFSVIIKIKPLSATLITKEKKLCGWFLNHFWNVHKGGGITPFPVCPGLFVLFLIQSLFMFVIWDTVFLITFRVKTENVRNKYLNLLL